MPRIAHAVLDSAAGYATAVRAGRHPLNADEPASRGGTDTGPSPYELLLAGLGAPSSTRRFADWSPETGRRIIRRSNFRRASLLCCSSL